MTDRICPACGDPLGDDHECLDDRNLRDASSNSAAKGFGPSNVSEAVDDATGRVIPNHVAGDYDEYCECADCRYVRNSQALAGEDATRNRAADVINEVLAYANAEQIVEHLRQAGFDV